MRHHRPRCTRLRLPRASRILRGLCCHSCCLCRTSAPRHLSSPCCLPSCHSSLLCTQAPIHSRLIRHPPCLIRRPTPRHHRRSSRSCPSLANLHSRRPIRPRHTGCLCSSFSCCASLPCHCRSSQRCLLLHCLHTTRPSHGCTTHRMPTVRHQRTLLPSPVPLPPMEKRIFLPFDSKGRKPSLGFRLTSSC